MPTYRNDGSVTYRIEDTDDIIQNIKPGRQVQTYDPNVPDDFTETISSPTVDLDISGENQLTGAIKPKGRLNISISGQFQAEIELQRSWDNFVTNGRIVDVYTISQETSIEDDDPNVKYRIGVPIGKHNSGQANVRLSR